jgi:hypothetical protein
MKTLSASGPTNVESAAIVTTGFAADLHDGGLWMHQFLEQAFECGCVKHAAGFGQ